jgi:hypothetical protein
MHVTSFQQQVRWLGGKRLDLDPWGSRIKSSPMAWVVVNIPMLTKYSLPT